MSLPLPRLTLTAAWPWFPAGSVALTTIAFVPEEIARTSLKTPAASALPVIDAPFVVFRATRAAAGLGLALDRHRVAVDDGFLVGLLIITFGLAVSRT